MKKARLVPLKVRLVRGEHDKSIKIISYFSEKIRLKTNRITKKRSDAGSDLRSGRFLVGVTFDGALTNGRGRHTGADGPVASKIHQKSWVDHLDSPIP